MIEKKTKEKRFLLSIFLPENCKNLYRKSNKFKVKIVDALKCISGGSFKVGGEIRDIKEEYLTSKHA